MTQFIPESDLMVKDEIKEVLANSFKPKILISLLQASIATIVIAGVIALIDGYIVTYDSIQNFLLISVFSFIGIFFFYLMWVVIKVIGVLDSHFDVTDKSSAAFGWLIKAFFGLIALGITIYALYFVLGGIAGLLKFGWKNL